MAANDRASGPGKAGSGSGVDGLMRASLSAVAPGTALRDGLERVLRGNTGGLIVLGMDKTVESMCTGGFVLDVEFTATRLRELCKLDGALILDKDATKIVRAGVQLYPDASIPTEETGTRHRTAQRASIQSGFPVVSVSQSMRLIALYVGGERRVLEESGAILSRANQALATLERYKLRLDEVAGTLSALEIEDLVTVRDVTAVSQRLEMVRRIATEIAEYVVELGTDGRLLSLQLDELIAGVEPERELVVRDYVPEPTAKRTRTVPEALTELDALTHAELLELPIVARALGYSGSPETLDSAVSPAATGCWPRCRGCRARSSSASWTTSAACRSSSPPAWTTCRRSTASARPAPARSARASRAWPSPRSWNGTSDPPGRARWVSAVPPAGPGRARRCAYARPLGPSAVSPSPG
ncbi:hypothetical protein GCM10020000_36220 [Streptomyces olivoverticillatus]